KRFTVSVLNVSPLFHFGTFVYRSEFFCTFVCRFMFFCIFSPSTLLLLPFASSSLHLSCLPSPLCFLLLSSFASPMNVPYTSSLCHSSLPSFLCLPFYVLPPLFLHPPPFLRNLDLSFLGEWGKGEERRKERWK
ncbi:hypothetical protein LINPERHAP1_LOCUS13957, partial [Linum perenne]